ncbi:hypothetical protein D3C87_123830 [compost metagenome]
MTSCKYVFFALLVIFNVPVHAKAAISKGQTTVAYFSLTGKEHFENKVKPLFKDNASRCKSCEIVNMTPYTKEGQVDVEALAQAIHALPQQTSFVFMDFNLKNSDENKAIVEALNHKAMAGVVVVASAGQPQGAEASSPLSRTILGQVQDAVIIGELSERDRLMPQGFYGPEMLTAVRPPKDMMGQGFGPLIFASALAENWQKRTSEEWVSHFKEKKMKTRKLWLGLNDLF